MLRRSRKEGNGEVRADKQKWASVNYEGQVDEWSKARKKSGRWSEESGDDYGEGEM